MVCQDYIIQDSERKCGQHAGREIEGDLTHLNKQGYLLHKILQAINCSPSTGMNCAEEYRCAKAAEVVPPNTTLNESIQSTRQLKTQQEKV